MSDPVKFMVVAVYEEDISWLDNVPNDWIKMIYSKGRTGFQALPNIGREANTYLHAIVAHYKWFTTGNEVLFCQGNPHDHDPRFLANIQDESIRHFGIPMNCSPSGGEHMTDADLHEYCRVFGLPVQDNYRFSTGAQLRLHGHQIAAHPIEFYQALLAITTFRPRSPYSLERLFPTIFGVLV